MYRVSKKQLNLIPAINKTSKLHLFGFLHQELGLKQQTF